MYKRQILSRDGYLPRQLHTRGDRLAFSNGIILLSGFAILLIVIFQASPTRLIQLYIIGVFVSFVCSQTGMIRHWNRNLRGTTDPGIRLRMIRSRAVSYTHLDGEPRGRPPARAPAHADDRGVGRETRQPGIERRQVASARVRHGNRVVQHLGRGCTQRGIDDDHGNDRQDARGRSLGKLPWLAADDLADGEGHWEDQQGDKRRRARNGKQGGGQVLAGSHDVGLGARCV